MAIITDLKAKHLAPDSKPIPHGGIPGLVLRPSKTKGHGFWVLRYTNPITKKRTNIGLGSYPEVSIAEVAKNAAEIRLNIDSGCDPQSSVSAQDEKSIPLFKEAACITYESLKPGWKNEKHAQQWINTVTQYAFPVIGDMPVDKVRAADIAQVLQPIWLEKEETASRLRQRIISVLEWAAANEYRDDAPSARTVAKLLPKQKGKAKRVVHHPSMPWKLIPEFIKNEVGTDFLKMEVTRRLLLFVILTACRSGEARGMTWAELDFHHKVWRIPANRMKAGQEHCVPLNDFLVKSLWGLQQDCCASLNDYVFTTPRKHTALSDMALTKFLRDRNAMSDTPDRVATAHGFRSSFRDWCSEHEYPRDLAERALAHTIANQVEAAYHRTDLLEQRRPMMQAWADFVLSSGK